ncbi:hypothetical protein [Ferruginibacter sp.]
MKKYLLFINLFVCTTIIAQVPEDALRYSFYPQNGTARNLAVGGAMGSLGGDLNATFVNPAGLGFYKTGEVVLTPGLMLNNNKADFRGTANQNRKNAFAFGPTGLIWGFGNRYKPKISNAISIAVTQTANFNNSIQYKGLNNYSSFSEQFAEEFAKSGYTIDEVLNVNSPLPYGSAPALYTYLIDTVKVNGIYQVKGAPEYILDAGQALRQQMNKTTKGAITEVAFAFAQNNNDKFYWGATVGIPLVNYTSNTNFQEFDTSNNNSNYFKSFEYNDHYTTTGFGFNAKLGVIYKPKEYIRLGLAVHTPSIMILTDKRTTTLHTIVENPAGDFKTSSETFTNDQPGESSYTQSTPFKAIISGSYVFREVSNTKKQRAFISADIEYVHYNGSRFRSGNENPTPGEKAYYNQLNDVVKDEYKGNFNFRVGGELKFNVFMTRLGFAYYSNPYQDAPSKINKMLLSGGLGYRDKGMFIDLTYVHNIAKDIDLPYRLQDRASTYASLKQQRGNVVATLGFKF